MRARLKLSSILLAVVAFAAGGTAALAASVASDDFSGGLNEKVWRVYSNSDAGQVRVADGRLSIEAVDYGWRQKGVMLQQPIDLTGKRTTIEIDYVAAGFNEQNPGFWNDGAIEGADTWNSPGFRLTVGGSGIGPTFTPPSDGRWDPAQSIQNVSPPYKLTWVLTHDQGSTFKTQVLIDGQSQYEGTIDVGSMDPKKIYFYLYVSNNDGSGPTVIDRVSISQTAAM